MYKKDYTKERFLGTLESNLCNVSNACKRHNISRQTFYDWVDRDPEFAIKYKEIREYVGDFVESKLLNKITNNDTTAIIFYCKTKLKDRGYVERVEQTGKDGESIEIALTEQDNEIIERALQRRLKNK